MTNFDVERDMRRANLTDQKIESLLKGDAPDAGDHLAQELAFMRQGLSEVFPLPVIPEDVEDSHLARMMAAVVPAPAFAAAEIVADRTAPLDSLKASLSRRVAAITLALSTAFGGAAYAGVLPDPLQGAVAKAASVLGLHLPGGDDEALAGDDSRGDDHRSDPDDDHQGIGPAGEDPEDKGRDGSRGAGSDGAEDRRDDERDAREDAEDDARDAAEDQRDDETDQREDDADDARDAREDAEDDARDAAEDQRDDETDQREDDADDARDAIEEAEDEAEESREELDELDDSRSERDSIAEDEASEPEDD